MAFRDEAINAFIKRFGEPERSPSEKGMLYRWRLKRERTLDVHVIIDSPEKIWQAHVLVSDPCPEAKHAVRSMYLNTMEEVQRAMDEIQEQWELRGCWVRSDRAA